MPDHPVPVERQSSIPQTSKRLQRAHDLWHEALASYNDVDRFTMYLNAAIQELRNSTWILQKERPPLPHFDTWYGEWQQRLKANPAARWIVDARNRITKRGDLEPHSTAKLSLVAHYGAPESILMDVPPTMPNEALARAYLLGRVSRKAKKHGTLIVERKWEVPEFPGRELLDVLAEAFSLIEALADDAHGRIAHPNDVHATPSAVRSVVPSCMAVTREARRLYVKLSTLSRMRVGKFHHSVTDEERMAVQERYGPPRQAEKDSGGVPDLYSQALASHARVRRLLEVDGYSLTFVEVSLPDGDGEMRVLMPNDKAELLLMMQELSEDVDALEACGIVLSGEAWLAPAATAPYGDAASSLERREAIITEAANKAGQCLRIITLFDRVGSAIIFRPTQWSYTGSRSLSAVREVWRRKTA